MLFFSFFFGVFFCECLFLCVFSCEVRKEPFKGFYSPRAESLGSLAISALGEGSLVADSFRQTGCCIGLSHEIAYQGFH